ncbi:MAG TPA: SRPBCC family protein, partial [Phycisphaerales bacterium]|nr:SRPBCC family protein [Phycisphaerales bacterium]
GSTAGAPSDYFRHGIHVEKAVTINRPAEELYRFWRQLENLPRVMGHLERVEVIDNTRSHWVAKAPAGFEVEWDAEIINDEPGALIAWKAVEGSQVPNAGSVRFLPAPPGRGTEVKVTLEYLPPAGRLGAAIAKLFGEEPSQQVRDDLARFKQLMESGEIASVEGQPAGRGAFETRGRGPRSPATVVGAAGADHGKNTPAPTVPGAAGSGLPGQTFGAGTQGPGSRPGPADGD